MTTTPIDDPVPPTNTDNPGAAVALVALAVLVMAFSGALLAFAWFFERVMP